MVKPMEEKVICFSVGGRELWAIHHVCETEHCGDWQEKPDIMLVAAETADVALSRYRRAIELEGFENLQSRKVVAVERYAPGNIFSGAIIPIPEWIFASRLLPDDD